LCFSAEASFGMGAGLVITGAVCVRTAWKRTPAHLPLAATPLLFGVQQLLEGVVWVGLGRDDASLVRSASVAYLFFALAFWPFWLPLCATFVESRARWRRAWAAMVLLGLAWAALLYGPILCAPERYLKTEIKHHSIEYKSSEVPFARLMPQTLLRLLYMILGGTALIAGSDETARRFGILLGLAAVLSRVVFAHAFASVWCFFAAALSFYLCYALCRVPTEGTAS
jgi:uncharacterized protein DUF6629